MFKRKGGGVKGLLNNVKKTALFLRDGFPYSFFCFLFKLISEVVFLFLFTLDVLVCC